MNKTNAKTNKSTEKKRKLIIVSAIAIALFLLAIFSTLAYLTSTTNTLDNVMTAGKIIATIDERTVDEYGKPKDVTAETPERTSDPQNYTMLPGHTYTKDPQIHIAEKSEPAYVFMVVNDPLISIEDQAGDGNTHQQMVGKDGTSGSWTQLYGLKLPDTLTGTLYVYNKNDKRPVGSTLPTGVVDAKTTSQTVEGFKYFKLQDSLTEDQIAAYNDKSINATGIAIQSDGFDTPQAAWEAVYGKIADTDWKSLTDTYKYYPVFADGAVPSGVEFATKKDDGTFTIIENPTIEKLADSAKAGTLYRRGGALTTVRSVNRISWYYTFKDNSGGIYPYHASTATTDLQETIKAQLITGDNVEGLCAPGFNPDLSSPHSNQPTINGIPITNIWNVYKDGYTGFGGETGTFYSCVAIDSDDAYIWICLVRYWAVNRISDNKYCVLVSRTFN